jgi:hypothetical protein
LKVVAESLQIISGSLILDVLHADVDSLYLEAWTVYAGTLGKQLSKQQRILAAREPYKHVVIVL